MQSDEYEYFVFIKLANKTHRLIITFDLNARIPKLPIKLNLLSLIKCIYQHL